MYSEFHQFTSMGSVSRPQLFILKEDEEAEQELNSKITSKETSQISDGLEEIAPKNPPLIQEDRSEEKEDLKGDIDQEDKCFETSVSSNESEKPCLLVGASTMEVADDDEGFKTPTSSDHKIPVITQCPPAPKKPRPEPMASSIKEKLPPSRTRRALFLDLSTQIESMFPPTIQDDDDDGDDDIDRKIKKARTDGHDSSE